jgi:hypothetical protein
MGLARLLREDLRPWRWELVDRRRTCGTRFRNGSSGSRLCIAPDVLFCLNYRWSDSWPFRIRFALREHSLDECAR